MSTIFRILLVFLTDIITQWKSLGELALLRQHQSRQLSAMYRELANLQASLAEVTDELQNNHFDSVSELHASIKYLQERSMEWSKDHATVDSLGHTADDFTQNNPELQMDTFSDEVDKVGTDLDDVVQRYESRVQYLHYLTLHTHIVYIGISVFCDYP